jgi:DNA-binding transcriptional MerR regulator
MPRSYIRTSEVARAAGVHPNTVRLYEEWGLIPAVPRSPSGYRLFTQAHVDHMLLARTALHGGWPGRAVRRSAFDLIRRAAAGDLGGALEQAYQHLGLVQGERRQAEAAASYLERWAAGVPAEPISKPLTTGKAAELLGITIDTLRSWERNGLLRAPRDPHSGYRQFYAADIGRLRVIRMLLRSGYSAMAILRTLSSFDAQTGQNLRQTIDTPRPDEDICTTADKWLSTLDEQEQRANTIIQMLETMIRK